MKEKKLWPFRRRRKAVLKMLKRVKKLAEDHDDLNYAGYVDLMIDHMGLLEKESECTQELYLQVIARTFNDGFKEFLTESSQEDEYGWRITSHNSKVQAEFILAGINLEEWLNYKYETRVKGTEVRMLKDKNLLWKVLDRNLDLLLVFFEKTALYGSLRKDCIEIRKKKAVIISGEFLVPKEWDEALFPKFHLTCNHLSVLKNIVRFNVGTRKDFDLVYNRINLILRSFHKTPVEKEFCVRLWRRDPRFDLLQGNFSDCCIAIGKENLYPAIHLPEVPCRKFPPGILNYLTDLGVQVAEVYDMDSEGPYVIGQCWLFVSLDDDGKPVLMADSFDLRSEYQESESQRAMIRDCMFDFLKGYAASCGISKVILGRSGPILKNLTRHQIHNGVYVDNLSVVNFQKPIEKLGGYFLNRPYFLETRGGRSAYVIAENLPVTITEKTEQSLVKLWRHLSSNIPALK